MAILWGRIILNNVIYCLLTFVNTGLYYTPVVLYTRKLSSVNFSYQLIYKFIVSEDLAQRLFFFPFKNAEERIKIPFHSFSNQISFSMLLNNIYLMSRLEFKTCLSAFQSKLYAKLSQYRIMRLPAKYLYRGKPLCFLTGKNKIKFNSKVVFQVIVNVIF